MYCLNYRLWNFPHQRSIDLSSGWILQSLYMTSWTGINQSVLPVWIDLHFCLRWMGWKVSGLFYACDPCQEYYPIILFLFTIDRCISFIQGRWRTTTWAIRRQLSPRILRRPSSVRKWRSCSTSTSTWTSTWSTAGMWRLPRIGLPSSMLTMFSWRSGSELTKPS